MTMRFPVAAAFLLGAASVLVLGARQDPKPAAPSAGDMQAMMQKARKFTEPGPMHLQLERLVGTWTTETRFVMGGQKTPPELGETVCSWSIAGRWLEMKAAGKLMGKAFVGQYLLGYDNFKQSFVMTTVNNVDTAMLRSEGDLTQDGKALILHGTLDEYLTGEHDKMVKYAFRFASADTFTFEVHDLAIGETGTQVMEVTYRKKG